MQNCLKLAIVGGGPSAFYVASRLMSLLPASSFHGPNLRIHMFDRLWAPHGLVRYGVAPDHPEVKNCTHKFDEAAQDPRFSFFGNVDFSSSSTLNTNMSVPTSRSPKTTSHPLSMLFNNYSHLLLATGAPSPILHPALPLSSYCIPALSLVHWYTDHPRLSQPPPALDKVEHVALIGQGNVSLDIARMLLTPPDVLAKYDVPEHVLEVLRRSAVKHVSIIGRRGPFEAAFTTKELREMTNLSEAAMVPVDPSLLVPTEGSKVTRQQSRTIDLLQKGSKNKYGTTNKTWSLDFFRSPTGLAVPASGSSGKPVLTLGHTTLDPATSRAVLTSETSFTTTDLVVTSLGYHSEPTMPFYDPALGHLRNVSGRVVCVPEDNAGSTSVLKNVYASGWAATGAKGVLASTMMNAYAVADTILSDYFAALPGSVPGASVQTIPVSPPEPSSGDLAESDGAVGKTVMNASPHPEDPPAEIVELVKQGSVTSYEDWKRVDEEEQRRGREKGKERERIRWEEARRFLGKA
ncbi:FAD/NAD P-binding domain-containing protein [Gloeophyllum trabeum ATCC 11539]|uniref:NADPH:adrenodoxin oxidoreductase, mitochondrial n=1 Tax=Gloeophyllum trabeum (strain ATCC 11539 / FP-39264 / Madison 617) TaxID=670483 RepID=S7RK87_GLOTA|nr:FAD/NAD P-binding domain-containing protein [Gloeophyllum trabeum ATCC 11539]EPQ53049.1 FAD/NAD P-binding domain-containing protein [Gloeophyllum trabeum ATCC 11539]